MRPTTRTLSYAVILLAVGFAFFRLIPQPPRFGLEFVPVLAFGGALVGAGILLMIFCWTGHRFTRGWENAMFAFVVLGVVGIFLVQANRRLRIDSSETLTKGYRLYLDGSYSPARFHFRRIAEGKDPDDASQARIYGDLCLLLSARQTPEVVEIAESRLSVMRRERAFASLRAEVAKARTVIGRSLREANHSSAAERLDLLFDKSLGTVEVGEIRRP